LAHEPEDSILRSFALIALDDSGLDPKANGGTAAIQWIIANIRKVYPCVSSLSNDDIAWQWSYALAAEFLRSSYRVDATASKRVLGLQAGYRAIIHAGEAFRRLPPG
jgi:hypothetical protein